MVIGLRLPELGFPVSRTWQYKPVIRLLTRLFHFLNTRQGSAMSFSVAELMRQEF
jgi:hypothetical protein